MDARHEDRWPKGSSSDATIFVPAGISSKRRNPEEALQYLARILRKVLTAGIYSQYVRKNLDLLQQGPRGIGR